MEFLYLFLYRILSGLQNGLGYADRSNGRIITTIILMLSAFVPALILLHNQQQWWVVALVIGGSLVSAIGAFGVEDSFNTALNVLPKDIHLWELLATAGVVFSVLFAGGDVVMIIGSVYPALLIHKGLINTYSGLPWWYHGTDDETGQTFTIPLLGISIPRLSVSGRIILAIVSVFFSAAAWLLHWNISLYRIIDTVF